MQKIAVINYEMGNIGSVVNMLKYIRANVYVANKYSDLKSADKLILPGVGAFDFAIRKLKVKGFWDELNELVLEKNMPILGICLGMQLLTKKSEEGKELGFGWIDAETYSFKKWLPKDFRVPHMGWNEVSIMLKNRLTLNLDTLEDLRFYFVHSYFVKVKSAENSMFKTFYGIEFDSGICKDNIFGVQFHPEKSHKYGIYLLKNFIDL